MGSDDYNQITVYADDEEKRLIERNAEAAGMSVSAYLKRRGTSENPIVDPAAREEEIEELRELRRLVGNISGNINQIAYHANRTENISEQSALAAAKAVEQAADTIAETLNELY